MESDSLYFTKEEQKSEAFKKTSAVEQLTFNVTEEIPILKEYGGVSKSELAAKLGKTKAHISQSLSGTKNMTLRTFSEICHVLDVKPSVTLIHKINRQ